MMLYELSCYSWAATFFGVNLHLQYLPYEMAVELPPFLV